jgi:Txe/YoeB family toxin of toxin-antitoxin system
MDEKILAAINGLVRDIKRNPFRGLGKPEPLKHGLQGWWSRRISGEHRGLSRFRKGRQSPARHRAVSLSLLTNCGGKKLLRHARA